jgi:hypothetical protein
MSQAITTKVELYADRVQRRVAAKKRRVLFKQGAYLRTTMQRSMRYRKAASKPGEPPSAHRETGAHLRQRIRFDVDLGAESVVCGPDLKPDSKVLSLKPLPQLLNEGGVIEGIGGEPVNIASRPFVDSVFSDGGKKFRELIEKEQL